MKLRLAKASQLSWSWGLAWLSLATIENIQFGAVFDGKFFLPYSSGTQWGRCYKVVPAILSWNKVEPLLESVLATCHTVIVCSGRIQPEHCISWVWQIQPWLSPAYWNSPCYVNNIYNEVYFAVLTHHIPVLKYYQILQYANMLCRARTGRTMIIYKSVIFFYCLDFIIMLIYFPI